MKTKNVILSTYNDPQNRNANKIAQPDSYTYMHTESFVYEEGFVFKF
jgi:hypothetical protein